MSKCSYCSSHSLLFSICYINIWLGYFSFDLFNPSTIIISFHEFHIKYELTLAVVAFIIYPNMSKSSEILHTQTHPLTHTV